MNMLWQKCTSPKLFLVKYCAFLEDVNSDKTLANCQWAQQAHSKLLIMKIASFIPTAFNFFL